MLIITCLIATTHPLGHVSPHVSRAGSTTSLVSRPSVDMVDTVSTDDESEDWNNRKSHIGLGGNNVGLELGMGESQSVCNIVITKAHLKLILLFQ